MPHFKCFCKKPSCITKAPPAGQPKPPDASLSGLVFSPTQSGGQPADNMQDLPLSRKKQPSPADLPDMQNLVRIVENAEAAQTDAQAYAPNNVIRFAPDTFRLNASAGRRSSAHGGSHTARQARGNARPDAKGARAYARTKNDGRPAGRFFVKVAFAMPITAQAAPIYGGFFDKIKNFFKKLIGRLS